MQSVLGNRRFGTKVAIVQLQALSRYRSIYRRAAAHRRAFTTMLRNCGVEALLAFWDDVERAFNESVTMRPIAMLVERGRQDFEADLIMLESGLYANAIDGARDLVEIEILFRHFRYNEKAAAEWFSASDEERKRRFGANTLRQAEAKRRNLKSPTQLSDAADYKGHSQSLHVSPRTLVFRGIVDFDSEQHGEWGFGIATFEVLRHAERTVREAWHLITARDPVVAASIDTANFDKAAGLSISLARVLESNGFPSMRAT
jgi:hypothetical protein